jgi:type I restriction enzyme S subunit
MKLESLGSYIKILSGFPFKSELFNEEGIGLPLIRVRDVNSGFSGMYYSGEYPNEYIICNGDILIGMDGDFNAVVWKYGTALLNQRVCKLVVDEKKLSKLYLLHYLPEALKEIHGKTTFTTVKHLSSKFIVSIQIPLPETLDDQIRIATILTRAERLIAKRKDSIKALDELSKSTFWEMFGDPVRNEKGWPLLPLGNRLTIKHGFAFKGEYFSTKGKYVLLTPGNFSEQGGYRDRGDKQKYYHGEIPQGYILNKDDLLIAMTEQAPGLLGSPLIVPAADKFLHNQRLGLIVLRKEGDLNKRYLFHLFNHPNIRRLIHSKATGMKVRHTSPSKLEEIQISLPPIDIQNQFAGIVEKIESIRARYTQSLEELENLYGSLSQRAFKGELDLSKVPLEQEQHMIEVGDEGTAEETIMTEVPASKTYSEAELIGIIRKMQGGKFTFSLLMNEIKNADFDEMPEYEKIKTSLYRMLDEENPRLSQVFDEEDKQIVLRVNP